MTARKFSRNEPCPCGSGKKFKNCCINKDIDWEARRPTSSRKPFTVAVPRPKTASPSGLAALLGPYRVVDTRLKEIARESLGAAEWKAAVEQLSDEIPDGERMAIYKAVREARVVPEDAAFFLFGHAAQWMPSKEDDLDRHILGIFRNFGLDDMADLYARNRLEFDRRHERGRQFFFGPPDEELAERLRERGIID